jgi:hypothetical protein
MNIPNKIAAIALLLLTTSLTAFSQDEDDKPDKPGKLKAGKGFHVGLMVGSFFANNATAGIYDGYGLDADGVKNSFENSFMYQKIWVQYGGHPPSYALDQVAQALSTGGQVVNHDGWEFTETDMPLQMRYIPAITLGLNCRYFVDKKNTLILNVNATQLTATGGFTITLLNQSNFTETYKAFAIKGKEQRLMFQLGYQRILGNHEKLNPFFELGVNLTMAKFVSNQIMINNLLIDLTTYYDPMGNVQGLGFRRPVAVNIGAFAGLGLNLTMSPKWTIQILYSPLYERLKLGYDTGLHLQHSAVLRAYYNF